MHIAALPFLTAIALADIAFKSRPDLTVPVWNITTNNKDELFNGYVFVTPYSAETPNTEESVEQPGAYIYKSDGELVWSSFSYFGGVSLNFQAANILGRDVLYAWEGQFSARGGHGFGHIKILDDHYRVITELKGGDHKLIDIHEFHLADNGKTGLVESYSPVQFDLSDYDDADDNKRTWIVNAVVQELDIETNELLFEWSSLDHVSPEHSVLNLTSGLAGDGFTSGSAWDYFHINSVDKNEKGDYLVSSRHTSTIYKIDGKTGNIIWRFSTTGDSDLKVIGESKLTFGFQHHARYIEDLGNGIEIISFFDNNAYSKGHSEPESSDLDQLSSGKIVKIDSKHKTVELLKQYDPPSDHPLSAKSQGSFQSLSNGNKFINWGSTGTISEFNEDGKILFNAKLDSSARGPYVQSYRAFKFNWNGFSNEDIAVAYEDGQLFVSWNGDTKTHSWELIDPRTGVLISRVRKSGFETSISVGLSEGPFILKAIGVDGSVLQQTTVLEGLYVPDDINSLDLILDWKQQLFNLIGLF